MLSYESLIAKFVLSLASVPEEEFFDRLLFKIDDYYDSFTCNSYQNLSKKNISLQKGILFERICYKLIESGAFRSKRSCLNNIEHVWMMDGTMHDNRKTQGYSLSSNKKKVSEYKSFPYRKEFEFSTKKDMGIDLIAKTYNNEWIAIQCKYRRKPKRKSTTIVTKNGDYKKINLRWSVNWKDLSTFYALCDSTGPTKEFTKDDNNTSWFKWIVMTNSSSINRQGNKKKEREVAICTGTFRNIYKYKWLEIANLKGNILSSTSTIKNNLNIDNNEDNSKEKIDQIRKQRLKFFDNLS